MELFLEREDGYQPQLQQTQVLGVSNHELSLIYLPFQEGIKWLNGLQVGIKVQETIFF